MSKQLMTGAEIVVKALQDQGVRHIFGYPGGAVLPIYDALFQQDAVEHILVRHEQGAAHAAEGYARSTGKAGVLLVTSGPGATNAVTGLADAIVDLVETGETLKQNDLEVLSNPTERLARRFGGLVLPTSFARAPRLLSESLVGSDLVLMLGVAESSEGFRVETFGRNRDEARLPDVDGERPHRVIVPGAPEQLPVTLDAERLCAAIAAAGIPASLSPSAGGYVCNHVLFSTLHALQGTPVRAGFLHVPADRDTHVTPRTERSFDVLVAAVEAALSSI